MSTSRWRRAGTNLLVLALTSALGLGLLELFARRLRAARGGGKEAQEDLVYTEYDPLLGWRKKPGARVTYRRREYTTLLAINSHGLRDPERGPAAPPGTCRLLALGDSFLEGYTVPLEETVTQRLERALGAGGRAAEVVNGGTLAYSTDQELLFYRSQGRAYGPRVVLLFFYYNDVVYNDRQDYFGRPKPVFEQRPEGLALHRYPVRELPAGTPSARDGDEQAGGSALRALVGELLWARAPGVYARLARLGLLEPVARRSARLELRVYERRAVPQIEQAWEKTAAILQTLAREAAGEQARLLVVYVPSRMEVQDQSWEATRLLYGLAPDEWERGQVARRLEAFAARDGYPVLDLTPSLRAADRGLLGRPYFESDGHWTARGHAAAAQAIEGFLKDQGWLVDCGTAR